MGTLILPGSGVVYIDANVLIYRVERIQPYFDVSAPLWDALDQGQQNVATSELSLLEVLVKPLQSGDSLLQKLFSDILYGTPGLASVPITRQILEMAAHIRASFGLKTPDALHAATALVEKSTLLVTNDPAFRRVPGLRVVVLSDLAAGS